ncbi:MAG: ABC transporter ATP-binding protein, partial [Chloroflexi bacterium]|nr:ABC transporter ATP-binding protein [Chloroflexota bacterium]
LGPSGSGKSTLLHAVAGFIRPTAGDIAIGGRVVATPQRAEPPERRSVGMVFQHYALWPHMTALETVAYPFQRSGMPRPDARREAAKLLELMGLGRLSARHPSELSGGEQQRIGLARALARRAALYLFDEPTAHLDVPLRAALQEELAEQRARTGAAAVHATHDVAEALAVADRVALLRDGRLVQVGTPSEVYEQPVDPWAASLTGPASILDVTLERVEGKRMAVHVGDHTVTVPALRGIHAQPGERRHALVRPDWAALDGPLDARVASIWYRGWYTDYRLETPAGHLTISERGAPLHAPGAEVSWRLDRLWPLAEQAST